MLTHKVSKKPYDLGLKAIKQEVRDYLRGGVKREGSWTDWEKKTGYKNT